MSISRMALRLETSVAWLTLHAALTTGYDVIAVRHGRGLWWARPMPRPIGEVMVSAMAGNALKVATGSRQGGVYTVVDIRSASELVLNALSAYALEQQAPYDSPEKVWS